jgi:hypothetical protein
MDWNQVWFSKEEPEFISEPKPKTGFLVPITCGTGTEIVLICFQERGKREIFLSLNLSMKCWNSESNPQFSRVNIVVVQVGAVKIICSSSSSSSSGGAHSGKRKEGMKLSSPPKLVEKRVCVCVSELFQFVKFHSQLCICCPIMPELAVLAPP